MSKKAFTLIELMIVLAILSIVFGFSYLREFPGLYKKSEKLLIEQEDVFRFRNQLQIMLKDSSRVVDVSNRQIVFDNFKLILSKDRSKIKINEKIFAFDNFRFSNFESFDGNCAVCSVRNQGKEYKLYLVPRKYNSNSNTTSVDGAADYLNKELSDKQVDTNE